MGTRQITFVSAWIYYRVDVKPAGSCDLREARRPQRVQAAEMAGRRGLHREIRPQTAPLHPKSWR